MEVWRYSQGSGGGGKVRGTWELMWSPPALCGLKLYRLLEFLGDGRGLVGVTGAAQLAVWDVKARAEAAWWRTVGRKLPTRFLKMPGGVDGLAVNPSKTVSYGEGG